MQKHEDFVVVYKQSSGKMVPAAGASVLIKTYPGGATATIYSDDGVTTKSNPITADAEGRYSFYAADGHYTRVFSGSDFNTLTLDDILLEDPANNLVPNYIVVDSIAALRALTGADLTLKAQVLGYYTKGDGGGGPIRYYISGASPGTYTDNGGSIIVPNGGNGSAAWLWEYSGPVYFSWFGAKADGTTDDKAAIDAAISVTAFSNFKLSGNKNTRYIGTLTLPDRLISIKGPKGDLNSNTILTVEPIGLTTGGHRHFYKTTKSSALGAMNTCSVATAGYDGGISNVIRVRAFDVGQSGNYQISEGIAISYGATPGTHAINLAMTSLRANTLGLGVLA